MKICKNYHYKGRVFPWSNLRCDGSKVVKNQELQNQKHQNNMQDMQDGHLEHGNFHCQRNRSCKYTLKKPNR